MGGCSVRTTILPLAAHCRRYSTRKKVSKMSMPSVGWSSTTMSASRSRWHATFKRCRSDIVRSLTRVCFTCESPRSSIRALIWAKIAFIIIGENEFFCSYLLLLIKAPEPNFLV